METQLQELVNQLRKNIQLEKYNEKIETLEVFKKKCSTYFLPEFKEEKIMSTLNNFHKEVISLVESTTELRGYFAIFLLSSDLKLVNLSNGIFRIDFEFSYQLNPTDLNDKESSEFHSRTISLRIPGKLYQGLRLLMAQHDFDNFSDFVREYLNVMILGYSNYTEPSK